MEYRKTKGESMGLEVSKPDKKMLPRFDISLTDLPEAKKWEVGETYEIALKITQTGISQHEGSKGHVSFDIEGIKVLENSPKEKVKRFTNKEEEY